MLADGPVIDYNYKEKKGKGNSAADVREMEELSDAWAKKNGKGVAGEKISLNEFLREKV